MLPRQRSDHVIADVQLELSALPPVVDLLHCGGHAANVARIHHPADGGALDQLSHPSTRNRQGQDRHPDPDHLVDLPAHHMGLEMAGLGEQLQVGSGADVDRFAMRHIAVIPEVRRPKLAAVEHRRGVTGVLEDDLGEVVREAVVPLLEPAHDALARLAIVEASHVADHELSPGGTCRWPGDTQEVLLVESIGDAYEPTPGWLLGEVFQRIAEVVGHDDPMAHPQHLLLQRLIDPAEDWAIDHPDSVDSRPRVAEVRHERQTAEDGRDYAHEQVRVRGSGSVQGRRTPPGDLPPDLLHGWKHPADEIVGEEQVQAPRRLWPP